jgi:hypothetical protein
MKKLFQEFRERQECRRLEYVAPRPAMKTRKWKVSKKKGKGKAVAGLEMTVEEVERGLVQVVFASAIQRDKICPFIRHMPRQDWIKFLSFILTIIVPYSSLSSF